MANASLDDDKPLDPAVARVQARLRRLILISGLTLGVGILAVFGAILYRIVSIGASEVPTMPAAAIAATLSYADLGLPRDATLAASGLDGGRLVLTYDHAAGHTLVFINIATLAVTGTLHLPLPAGP